jgi:hypothetical protein
MNDDPQAYIWRETESYEQFLANRFSHMSEEEFNAFAAQAGTGTVSYAFNTFLHQAQSEHIYDTLYYSGITESLDTLTRAVDYLRSNISFHSLLDPKYSMPPHIVKICESHYEHTECPVCLEPLVCGHIKITSCGHPFCNTCFSRIDRCAVCKAPPVRDAPPQT